MLIHAEVFFLSIMPISGVELEKRKIIDRVICQEDPLQSYTLYIPSNYRPEEKWPILYAFDPGARGKIPVELFMEAAEKYNYILVGSNNSRNGPWENNFKAAKALFSDTHIRFTIDDSRVYTTGFSGGARVASAFSSMMKKPVAGIIACSGGLPQWQKADELGGSFFFGTAGTKDFNYVELKDLDETLDSLDAVHRIRIFDGGHEWPPPSLCMEAVEWMQLQAMKSGHCPRNNGFIEYFFNKYLIRARHHQSTGNFYEAALAYDAIAIDFKGIKDVSQAEKEASRLKSSPSFKQHLDREKKALKKESRWLKELNETWNQLQLVLYDSTERSRIIRKLQVNSLLKKAQGRDDVFESMMAHRLLGRVVLNAYSEGMSYLEERKPAEAVVFLEVASEAGFEKPYVLYNLACAYSLKGERKKALKALKLAVERGFSDVEMMEKDEDLAPIREEEEFKAIEEILKKKKEWISQKTFFILIS